MFSCLNPGAVRMTGCTQSQAVDLAQRFGFAGLDPVLDDPAVISDPAGARAAMDDAGLKVGGWGLPVQFRQDEATWRAGLDALPAVAARAATIGAVRCITYLMPFHDELDADANFDLHVQRLTPIAAVLADHGCRFGLEFVGPATLRAGKKHAFLHDLPGLTKLIDAIGQPNVGVLMDSFHWHTSRATAEQITDLPAERIVYVHVNDAIAGRSPEEQIDNERALPLETGVIDAAAFAGAVKAAGYDGPVVAEPFLSFEGLSHEEIARRTADSVNRLIALA